MWRGERQWGSRQCIAEHREWERQWREGYSIAEQRE